MILNSLCKYYERKKALVDSSQQIAPEGFEKKEISFLIVLDREGRFLGIKDTRSKEEKTKRATSFLVPAGIKKTRGIAANFLWENLTYIFGIAQEENNDSEKAEQDKKNSVEHEKANAFLSVISSIAPMGTDEGTDAVIKFLTIKNYSEIFTHPLWIECIKSKGVLSFQLESEGQLICQRPRVLEAWLTACTSSDKVQGTCLITGKKTAIERLHPSIKGVRGAQSSGANIVSFNQDAFSSYGRIQGENAPCGESAVFAYTTALNTLLSKDSRQKLQVANTTIVFWSERNSFLEENFLDFFEDAPKDDPDAKTQLVKSLYSAPHNAAMGGDEEDVNFYVLGLGPNNARLSIDMWQVMPIRQLSNHLRQYFEDISINHNAKEPPYLSLKRLLVSAALRGKFENVLPRVSIELFNSIILDQPFAVAILQNLLLRIRSDKEIKVNYPRAALLKAWLNRWIRKQNSQEKELCVSLDSSNQNVGYCLGRLFAVLEKIQKDALPGINSTIRERYYSAASMRPASVFAILMRLKNHHLSKLDNKVYYEKLLQTILSAVSEFPVFLNLLDQGRFAIGYYHQQQEMYKKKEEVNNVSQ